MRIAITGATGFVGSALVPHLTGAGHTVVTMARGQRGDAPGCCRWDPAHVDAATFTAAAKVAGGPLDAVVHLAGENVAAGRWTAARRAAIAASRGPVTTSLSQALAALPQPPKVLVSASATGIYGDRGDEALDEESRAGRGFLAEVASAWEAGTAPAAAAGIRTVHLRLGMVLDRSGGALARMLLPFRLGLGGRLGSGRQWMSWITRRDLLAAIEFALGHATLQGPVLAVAPQPVTNREFTAALGRALHRPTWLPAPAFALRLLFGAMADELLLASCRARPQRLLTAGFRFADPELGPALAALVR